MDSRSMVAAARKEVRLAARSTRKSADSQKRGFRPARTVGTLAAVLALIAGVAIPAYAATQIDDVEQAEVSVRQQAEGEAQGFATSADAAVLDLASTTYSATSAEEIAQKKAEEEALARALEAQRQQEEHARQQALQPDQEAQPTDGAGGGAPAAVDAAPAPPVVGAGGWVTPVAPGTYTLGDGLGAGRGHQGVDLLAPTGTPIYAAQSCVVGYVGWSGAFGNLITLDCNLDGQQVTIKNAHLMDGGFAVSAGQHVAAGEVIGYMGSTGRSTAPHLHLEVWVNGSLADPHAYMAL